MTKYYVHTVITKYWKPGTNYLKKIINTLEEIVHDGDFVIVSEKALSIASGNILDERVINPSLNARLLARFWMQMVWGNFLCLLCHHGQKLRLRLLRYPLKSGSRHKQVALQQAGLLQALMWGSEGGIDGSNLPYSYVSLPLPHSNRIANEIRKEIWLRTKKRVSVIISDSDKTYSFRNFNFTSRPNPVKGIKAIGGIIPYVIGRTFKLKRRSTPLAVAGVRLHVLKALIISNIADKARGSGSGATVWDMAVRFRVPVTEVNWEMLSKIKHKPIVIIRKK